MVLKRFDIHLGALLHPPKQHSLLNQWEGGHTWEISIETGFSFGFIPVSIIQQLGVSKLRGAKH